GLAGAHASLESSDPANGAVLDAAPSQVTMSFSENVEVGFSVFAVHRLDVQLDVDDGNFQQRLSGLAAPLVSGWLDATKPGETVVPTRVEPDAGAASAVELRFAEELGAGHYVVTWRLMPADIHPVRGFHTFSLTPH